MERNYKDLFLFIKNLEEKYNLSERCVFSDLYYWKLYRFQLHRNLLKRLDLTGKVSPRGGKFKKKKKLSNSILFHSSRVDSLVLEHSRKIHTNGKYIDPYSYYFVDDFDFGFRLLESDQNDHLAGLGNKRFEYKGKDFDLAYEYWVRFNRKRYSIPKEELKILNAIETEIQNVWNLEIKIVETIQNKILLFAFTRKYFKFLLKRTKPNKVFLVCSYGKEAEIQAAHDMGIHVVEFQHGLITDLHPGYSFIGWEKIPYFPDEIYAFGPAWIKGMNWPKTILTYKGFPHLTYQLGSFDLTTKKIKQVVIISQWILSRELLEISRELAALMPDWNFVYKFHPMEKGSSKFNDGANLKFADDNLYDLLSESEWVIGVSSTAIFEAIAFKCKIAIINLLSAEQMLTIARENDLPYCNNSIELKNALLDNNQKIIDPDDWFVPVRSKTP